MADDATVALFPALEGPVLELYDTACGASLSVRLALVSVIIAAGDPNR